MLDAIRTLVRDGDFIVSRHGFRELAADDILLDDVLAGIETAVVVEEYPDGAHGRSILVLQRDRNDKPVHVVWGIAANADGAVLVTSYRPDPLRWSDDFQKRVKR